MSANLKSTLEAGAVVWSGKIMSGFTTCAIRKVRPQLSALALAIGAVLAAPVMAQIAMPQTQPMGIVQAAQNNAAAASAAAAGSMVPAGVAPAAVQVAPSVTTGAVSPLPITGGKGPTIEALSSAQRLEMDAEVKKRLAKALDANTPPVVAVPMPAIAVPSQPVPVVKLPPPDTTKTVVAIYGLVGQEVADIRMPNGTVVIAKAGSNVGGYEVVRVAAQAVEFIAKKSERKSVARKSSAPVDKHVVRHARPKTMPADGGLYIEPTPASAHTIRVAVGGTFK